MGKGENKADTSMCKRAKSFGGKNQYVKDLNIELRQTGDCLCSSAVQLLKEKVHL